MDEIRIFLIGVIGILFAATLACAAIAWLLQRRLHRDRG